MEERDAPHGGVRVDYRGKLGFDLLKCLFLGGLELGDEVGVFPEGRGAEGDDVHERGDKALVEGFGGWGLWGFLRGGFWGRERERRGRIHGRNPDE